MSGFRVIVAGGGVAGVEAMLRLRRLAGDLLDVTLLAPGEEFAVRALSVREPFAARGAERHALADIAARCGGEWLPASVKWVDSARRVVHTDGAGQLAYDALLLAPGARVVPAFEHATSFRDDRADELFGGIVRDVEGGYASEGVAFLMPEGPTWRLPLYELALMTAERAGGMGADLELSLVTPEPAPLAGYGDALSARLADALDAAGVVVYTAASAQVPHAGHVLVQPHGLELRPRRVIAMPRVVGPALPGIPCGDVSGFIPIDAHCRVPGGDGRIFAAGDATAFPIKNGGLSAQQADTAAAGIARLAGVAGVEAGRFHPVLRGTLFTGGAPLYFQSQIVAGQSFDSEVSDTPLWPAAQKVMAEEINAFLEQ